MSDPSAKSATTKTRSAESRLMDLTEAEIRPCGVLISVHAPVYRQRSRGKPRFVVDIRAYDYVSSNRAREIAAKLIAAADQIDAAEQA